MRYTKAKKGKVVIKLHLEKAYDRLEWGSLRKHSRMLGSHKS